MPGWTRSPGPGAESQRLVQQIAMSTDIQTPMKHVKTCDGDKKKNKHVIKNGCMKNSKAKGEFDKDKLVVEWE